MHKQIKGSPGESLYEDSELYHFNFTAVTASELKQARRLRDASKHIESIQAAQVQALKLPVRRNWPTVCL